MHQEFVSLTYREFLHLFMFSFFKMNWIIFLVILHTIVHKNKAKTYLELNIEFFVISLKGVLVIKLRTDFGVSYLL